MGMKFLLLGVCLLISGIESFTLQPMEPRHGAKDGFHLTNPTELVSMMEKVDPSQLEQVVSMLEKMLADSKKFELEMNTKVNVTSQEFAEAEIELDAAESRKTYLDGQLNKAKEYLEESLKLVEKKGQELLLAKQHLDDQEPNLLQEQNALREVITKLEELE